MGCYGDFFQKCIEYCTDYPTCVEYSCALPLFKPIHEVVSQVACLYCLCFIDNDIYVCLHVFTYLVTG